MSNKIQCASKLLNSAVSSAKRPKLLSQVLCYPDPIPKEKSVLSSCKSLKLMLNKGFIKHVSPGVFNLMPLAVKSLEKLCNITDILLTKVDGQKVLFPTLIPKSLMDISGRWGSIDNLFKLKDRNLFDFCLGPTHEEIASSLMSKIHLSYKSFPLRIYQISNKFRDEMNPKLGLLRGREFLMKDMYTFDINEEDSQITYEAMCDLYSEFFQLLGIETIKVKGSSGDIGGKSSHEFHFLSDSGEDEIFYCPKCKLGINGELDVGENLICQSCESPLQKCNSIEVGHAFLLGTTYSEPFSVKFDSSSHILENLQMGCYGLGLTRILAASIECLSTSDNIRWPFVVAPYYVSVIPPKKGSKEESVRPFADSVSESLCKIDWLSSNVLIDDRTSFTIGKRVQDASAMGVLYVVVVGKCALEEVPKLEVIDIYKNQTHFLSHKETISFFTNEIVV